MFRSAMLVITGALFSHLAIGNENFVANPSGLYPPGCASTGNINVWTPSNTRRVFANSIIKLTGFPDTSKTVNVNTAIYRRGCSEPNRSMLFVEFELLAANGSFFMPSLFVELGGTRYPVRLLKEANTFETNHHRRLEVGKQEFVVDGVAESDIAGTANLLSVSQYNSALTLIIQDAHDSNIEYSAPVGVLGNNIKPIRYPLNGRLAGVWVVEGAVDQGFVLSFNEFVTGTETRQQVFFSWYTFAADGSLLWLTAGNFYAMGTEKVDMEIELVSNGEFLGDTVADREIVGTATLTALSCNELTLEFDLEDLGLGTGTVTLVRLFSLEVAGYACRDQEARIDAL